MGGDSVMAAILPKNCCDCATVTDPCACSNTYLITVNATYSIHYLQVDPDSGVEQDIDISTTITNLQIYTSVPPDNSFSGSQNCATTGTLHYTFGELTISCDGGVADETYTYYVLCDGEETCFTSGTTEYRNNNKPGASVSSDFTATPSGPNYTFVLNTAINPIQFDTYWKSTSFYDDYSDTFRSGNLKLTQDIGADQNYTIYLQFGENDTRTIYSYSFDATIDISKVP
jgi:hypothetical protein